MSQSAEYLIDVDLRDECVAATGFVCGRGVQILRREERVEPVRIEVGLLAQMLLWDSAYDKTAHDAVGLLSASERGKGTSATSVTKIHFPKAL